MNAVKVKKCRICNEPASGFNFGGQLSCEACKLFFYRNASKIDVSINAFKVYKKIIDILYNIFRNSNVIESSNVKFLQSRIANTVVSADF